MADAAPPDPGSKPLPPVPPGAPLEVPPSRSGDDGPYWPDLIVGSLIVVALAALVARAAMVFWPPSSPWVADGVVGLGVAMWVAVWWAPVWMPERLYRSPGDPRPSVGSAYPNHGDVMACGCTGLLMSALVLLGVFAVKDNAEKSGARNRVLEARALVEDYRGAHGRYPDAGTFTALWRTKHPLEADRNPWRVAVPPAVVVLPDLVGVQPDVASAVAAADAAGLGRDPARAGELAYVRIVPGPQGAWRGLYEAGVSHGKAVQGYAVGIRDADGVPWWSVQGGP